MLLCLLHYCQGLSCHMNARVGPISPGKHAVPYSDLPVKSLHLPLTTLLLLLFRFSSAFSHSPTQFHTPDNTLDKLKGFDGQVIELLAAIKGDNAKYSK